MPTAIVVARNEPRPESGGATDQLNILGKHREESRSIITRGGSRNAEGIGIELRKFLNERSAAGVAGPAIDRNLRLFAADVQTPSTAGKDLGRSVFPDAGRIRTTGALLSDGTSNAFLERV